VRSIIAAVTAVCFFAVYLWRFDFGLISLNNGVDWANHMWMIDIIYYGESFDSPEVGRLIGSSYVVYPHSSHYLAAWLARATGASPLQTIHWLANAAVITSAAIVAGQIAAIMAQAKHVAGSLLVGVAGIGMLHLSASWGIGFSQQLQWNYFYPQAVGIALGLGALLGFQQLAQNQRFLWLLLASVVAAFILATFHPTPAAWAGACGMACAFSIRGSAAARLARAAVTGALSAGAMLLLPGFRWGVGLLGPAGGDVNTWGHVLNLSLQPFLLMAALTLLAVLLLVAVALYGWDEALRTHAGAAAVVGCGFFAAAILFSASAKEFYSVAKYNSLYGPVLSVLVASIVLWFADRWLNATPGRAVSAVAALSIPIAVLAQKVYDTAHVGDQRYLIEARAQAQAGLLREVPRWPGNTERYYFAGSALREPMPEAIEYLMGRR
jgi:hypothetical protein